MVVFLACEAIASSDPYLTRDRQSHHLIFPEKRAKSKRDLRELEDQKSHSQCICCNSAGEHEKKSSPVNTFRHVQ